MRYNEIGINVDSVDKLILDIYDCVERINKTLNQIANVVDQTKVIYECEAANNYRNKFNNFSANFKVVDSNLRSYADDLIKLKNRYQTIDSNITDSITRATTSIQSEFK